MFQVQPEKRATIDAWAVREAGLPTRVINSVEAAGVYRIGDLREWSDTALLRLRSLGRISLDQIRAFFELCERVEQGRQAFDNVREALLLFLDEAQFSVLSARYGFDRSDFVASNSRVTLQDIGNRTRRTRERIRQIEENGKERLGSRLATVCLQPFADHAKVFIRERADIVADDETAALIDDPAFDGLNPCAIFMLLSDLLPDQIVLHNDCFTLLQPRLLETVERLAREALEASPSPLSLQVIAERAASHLPADEPLRRRQCVEKILDHAPQIGAAKDGRYFLFDSSVQSIVEEVLGQGAPPMHYRAVTRVYNDRVKPLSRRGAGFILDMLNRNPRCVRVDRGLYRLAGG